MDEFTKFQIYLISAYLAKIVKSKFGTDVYLECFDNADKLFDNEQCHSLNDEC